MDLLQIGTFSKLAQVSVSTLRFYDAQGLLKPEYIDPMTGYRYYRINQLARLNRILALKDLGFALDRVQPLIDDEIGVDQLAEMLTAQEQDLEKQIFADQQRLDRVRSRLHQLQSQSQPTFLDVVLKQGAELWIVGNRMIVPTAHDIDFFSRHMFGEIEQWLYKHKLDASGARMTLYHTDDYIERDYDMEVAIVLPYPPAVMPPLPHGGMRLEALPALPLMATTVYEGVLRDVNKVAYDLLQWVVHNGYTLPQKNMALREIFLNDRYTPHRMDALGLVELQLPINSNAHSLVSHFESVDSLPT
jgi:DNA-binding transcriptional MerR regulator